MKRWLVFAGLKVVEIAVAIGIVIGLMWWGAELAAARDGIPLEYVYTLNNFGLGAGCLIMSVAILMGVFVTGCILWQVIKLNRLLSDKILLWWAYRKMRNHDRVQ
jgi:hypothetical protein